MPLRTCRPSEDLPLFLATLPSAEQLEAKCLELGLVMRRAPAYDITHPALSLSPKPISKKVLRELYGRQLLWNEAVDRTARNFTFLEKALLTTAASDTAFTGRFLQMLRDVYLHNPDGYQPIMLGIFRTDYMHSARAGHDPRQQQQPEESAADWKNVEINTISVSFAGLSPLVCRFQNYLARYRNLLLEGGLTSTNSNNNEKAPHNNTNNGGGNAHAPASTADDGVAVEQAPGEIAQSPSGEMIPSAIAAAAHAWAASVPWTAFQATAAAAVAAPGEAALPLQPVVLVVMQENERNTGDQYKLLFELTERHQLLSIRRTLTELHASLVLQPPPGGAGGVPFAVVENKYVASVVYFRSTYTPVDFPTEATWEARERLERSNAVKCPSLPYHLMTWKKLQQLMTDVEGVLAPVSFAGDTAKAALLATHFMPQYSLNAADAGSGGAEKVEAIIADAVRHPTRYVLKPQLEGGGNLIAGETMQKLLRDSTHAAEPEMYHRIRQEYILMEKILFPHVTDVLFRMGQMHVIKDNVCSELGIFGVTLSAGEAEAVKLPPYNKACGYVVRSKPADVEDGGVMAGVACLDCVQLS